MKNPTHKFSRKLYWIFLMLLAVALLPARRIKAAEKPLSEQQVLGLVRGGVASQRVAQLVRARGIDFEATPEFLRTLQKSGAQKVLLDVLRSAPRELAPPPAAPVQGGLSSQAEAFAGRRLQAQQYANRGKDLLQRGVWSAAEQELRRSIQLNPDDPATHFYLGRVLNEEERPRAAIAQYRQSILLAPDSGPAHCDLGNVLLKTHDLPAAIEQYRQALSLNPDDEKANYGLGTALYEKGDWSGAAAQFHSALRLEPADVSALCALGLTLFRERDLNAAVQEYRAALKLNPHSAMAHADLAYVLLQKGERQEALQEFRTAALLAPKDVRYRASYENLRRQLNP